MMPALPTLLLELAIVVALAALVGWIVWGDDGKDDFNPPFRRDKP